MKKLILNFNISSTTSHEKQNVYADMKRSRQAFIFEGITGIGQFSLTNGAFLAGFIALLGGSDRINGMIAVTPAIAGVFQIVSPLIFERMVTRKKTAVLIAVFLRLFLSSVFFLPIIMDKIGIGLQTFIVLFALAYTLNALLAPVISNWMVEVTPMDIRGKYLAAREKIALLVTAVMTIVLGKVLDFTELNGNSFLGFIIVGIVLVVLGIINVLSVLSAVEIEGKNEPKVYHIQQVLTVPLKDKNFRKIILLFIIWSFALQIGAPFISVYLKTNIHLSYTYILTNSVISTVVRVLFTTQWGKIADNKSWFLSTKLSLFILAIDHILWGFVTADNYWYLVPLLHVVGGFAWGGIGISLFNIQFLFAKREGRTMYLGLNAAIGGLFSLFAVWIGGLIVDALEGVTFQVLIWRFGGMQMTFLLSGIFVMLCPLFVHFVLEKDHPPLEHM